MIERLEQKLRKADERGKNRVRIKAWELHDLLVTIEQLQKQVADLRAVYETFDAQRDLARLPAVEADERLINALRQLAQTRSQLDQYEAWAKEGREMFARNSQANVYEWLERCPIQIEKEADQ